MENKKENNKVSTISKTEVPKEQEENEIKTDEITTNEDNSDEINTEDDKNNTSTTTNSSSSNKSSTSTSKTTQKQTTTQKVVTTTKTTTTKSVNLSRSDIEWVQAQANEYIRSKGMTVDSSVRSYSGRISSKNFTSKESLLNYVKVDIDYEYQHCIDSGWTNGINMYVKIEERSDGSYYIYILYG